MTAQTSSAPLRNVQLGEVICDLSRQVIEVDGQIKHLEPRLAGVLALLIQRGEDAVTRDEFLDTVWDEDGSDEALTQAISRLRQLLGDRSLIQTLPRLGYRLSMAPVPVEMPISARAEPAASEPPATASTAPPSYLHGLAMGAALTVILVLVGVLYLNRPASMRSDIELEIIEGEETEFHRLPESGG